jgi:hypothetical protein
MTTRFLIRAHDDGDVEIRMVLHIFSNSKVEKTIRKINQHLMEFGQRLENGTSDGVHNQAARN